MCIVASICSENQRLVSIELYLVRIKATMMSEIADTPYSQGAYCEQQVVSKQSHKGTRTLQCDKAYDQAWTVPAELSVSRLRSQCDSRNSNNLSEKVLTW